MKDAYTIDDVFRALQYACTEIQNALDDGDGRGYWATPAYFLNKVKENTDPLNEFDEDLCMDRRGEGD
jgi:hypothetical protein